MSFRQQTFTSVARVALAGVTLIGVQALASPAEVAGRRPFFQMPVACGQTWEASTYDGHWPDQDSIDLGQWSTADSNVSKGEPVLASADGTVLDVFTNSSGDIRVYLDHGGGWVTHYIHLEQVPPLSKGQKVAQGEQIGRVGNSGTEAYHLHYSQLADGAAVRIAFKVKTGDAKVLRFDAGGGSSTTIWSSLWTLGWS
jgi:murein DD-endopeptidase MepM/ murein hydrolase activator NlpD